ncbi:BCD1 [Candida pseudojiufengensis]|uniref:BCD1 n=1 Tax=Candida pseudojiufengensis TaxID=497109 RepID=UPI002225A9B9|nr:BCD1 [Candida pseudojiufengensis]KAI5965294.1 BCD1 [Candida pseudojiufengensis]
MEQSVGKCAICQTNQFKYTCPACEIKSCSLNCYKTHQAQTSCTGKIDNTKFINQEELSRNPNHLNRDYNFLLQVDRKIQLSKEDLKNNAKNVFRKSKNDLQPNRKRFKKSTNDIEDSRKILVNKVFNDPPTTTKRENTLVIQLPTGMQRSISNKTSYDKKSNAFVWTIEWKLLDKSGMEITNFTSFRLKENLTLKEAIPINILNNHNWSNKDGLKFYLKNVLNTPKDSVIELDENSSISLALSNKIVLEYPTIYVTQDENVLLDKSVKEQVAYQVEVPSISNSETNSSTSEENSSEDSDSSSDSESDSGSDSSPEVNTSKPPVSIKTFDDAKTDDKKPVELEKEDPVEKMEEINILQSVD